MRLVIYIDVGYAGLMFGPEDKSKLEQAFERMFWTCPSPIVFFLWFFGHVLPMKSLQPVSRGNNFLWQ